MTTLADSRARLRLEIEGAVQGVGFRPYAFRLAEALGLAGRVRNTRRGAAVEIEGPPDILEEYVRRLWAAPPPIRVLGIHQRDLVPLGRSGFTIAATAQDGPREAPPPADLALCLDCRRELFDPTNRRYRYPFTACSHCGPRFSIVEAVPYDRERTTLRGFPLCPSCREEYEDPGDRRFHAQATGCPDCGPRAELWSSDGAALSRGEEALGAAVRAIRDGKIVAVKGLGGFHLLTDARRAESVGELRRRKAREEKPFAVMFPDRWALAGACELSEAEAGLWASPEGPIVLLCRRNGSPIAENVAPGNPELGALSPTTPLHALLLSDLKFPVVATSGNRTDEPICTDEREALGRLAGIADFFLVHNRPIVRPVEDSLARVVGGETILIRRARGHAPGPMPLAGAGGAVLALGGHMKNTVALADGRRVVLGPHGGDLDTPQAVDAFHRAVEDLPRLHGVRPARWAADFHPDYASTRFARERSEPVLGVQHHHAHFAACLAEHSLDGPALGVVWDGSGWGEDGTVWGGEFLAGGRAAVRRFAHFRTFPLPGGESAVRDARRSALGLLFEMRGKDALENLEWFSENERRVLFRSLERGIGCPRTSSAGRMFDAVSALLGVKTISAFEGQAAMALEHVAEEDGGVYPFALQEGPSLVVDWAPLLEALLEEKRGSVSVGRISARFHNTLVDVIAAVARRAGEKRVALSGGCFQNARLLSGAAKRLSVEGFEVLFHRKVPTNDGGLSLGQAAVVLAGGGVSCV